MTRLTPKSCDCGHGHTQYTSTGVFDTFAEAAGFVYTWSACTHHGCDCDRYCPANAGIIEQADEA